MFRVVLASHLHWRWSTGAGLSAVGLRRIPARHHPAGMSFAAGRRAGGEPGSVSLELQLLHHPAKSGNMQTGTKQQEETVKAHISPSPSLQGWQAAAPDGWKQDSNNVKGSRLCSHQWWLVLQHLNLDVLILMWHLYHQCCLVAAFCCCRIIIFWVFVCVFTNVFKLNPLLFHPVLH